MDELKRLLMTANVNYTQRVFESSPGVGRDLDLFVSLMGNVVALDQLPVK